CVRRRIERAESQSADLWRAGGRGVDCHRRALDCEEVAAVLAHTQDDIVRPCRRVRPGRRGNVPALVVVAEDAVVIHAGTARFRTAHGARPIGGYMAPVAVPPVPEGAALRTDRGRGGRRRLADVAARPARPQCRVTVSTVTIPSHGWTMTSSAAAAVGERAQTQSHALESNRYDGLYICAPLRS